MENINKLHKQAMEFADKAHIARRNNDNKKAIELSKKAFQLEKSSALLLYDKIEIEPTRSILFKSAAWLACNAEDYISAKKMLNFALDGNPSIEIKNEIDEISDLIQNHNIQIIVNMVFLKQLIKKKEHKKNKTFNYFNSIIKKRSFYQFAN